MSEQRLAVAQHWLDSGRPERTLETLDSVADGTSTDALRLRASALLQLDRSAEAVRTARRALAADPEDLVLLSTLAAGLSRLDDHEGAEAALLLALRRAPQNPGLLVQYARLLSTAGQVDKASQVLDRAAAIEPAHPDVVAARALLAMAARDDKLALRLAREAVALDPSRAGARALSGSAAALAGQQAAAYRDLRFAASQQLGDPDLRAAAREASVQAHPLLLPLRPLARFHPGAVWVGGVTAILLSSLLLPAPLPGLVVLAWLLLCVYSWFAPPLVGWWIHRRYR